MISLNNIMQALENFANNHFFLQSFSHGNVEEMNEKKFEQTPYMHVVYAGSDYAGDSNAMQKVYSFEVYFVSQPPNKEGNKQDYQREAISDMEKCAEDLIADINNGFNIFTAGFNFELETASLSPLEEETTSVLCGCVLSIDIAVPYLNDACDAPLTGVTPGSGDCDDGTIDGTRDGDPEDTTYNIGSVSSGGTFTFAKVDVKQQNDDVEGYGEVHQNMEIKLMNADISSVVHVGAQTRITADISTPSGIQYKPIIREVDTSYDTYDNGWWFINNLSSFITPTNSNPATIQRLDASAADPFNTLKFDNIHGNKNRFTAQDGSQTVAAGGVIEDHLHYMEWINTVFSSTTRANHLTNAYNNTTDGGTTNRWRLMTCRDYLSILDYSNSGAFGNLLPFTAVNMWTSDRYAPASANSLYAWGGMNFSRRAAGSYSYVAGYCRQGTW